MVKIIIKITIIFLVMVNSLVAQDAVWRKLETEPYAGKQDDIAFVDENTGWYVNGFGKIFHTKDEGATWEKQLEQKGSFFRTVAFVDKNTGFVGTV